MYYISEIINGNKLHCLGGWYNHTKNTKINKRLDDLFFRITSLHICYCNFLFIQKKCIEEYEQYEGQLNIEGEDIGYWSEILIDYLGQVNPFFSNLRIIQNLILPIFSTQIELKCSIPSSMSNVIKKIESYGFNEKVISLVLNYWEKSGKRSKDFRDVDQHHHALLQKIRFRVVGDKGPIIYLPDNPEVKSSSNLTFNKNIELMPFAYEAYQDLIKLLECIAQETGFKPEPVNQTIAQPTIHEDINRSHKTHSIYIGKQISLDLGQTQDKRVYAKRIEPKK